MFFDIRKDGYIVSILESMDFGEKKAWWAVFLSILTLIIAAIVLFR